MSAPKLSLYGLASLTRAALRPGAVLGRRIGTELREQIILHVSAVNECAVCSVIHGAGARACGLDSEAIRAARQQMDQSDLDERTKVALRYAGLRTQGLEESEPVVCEAFDARFDERERDEVRTIVDLFTFNNQFNNSWEGVLPGADARRRWVGIDGESS
jgi:AhpD family alkylhydroperoxidase